LQEAQQGSMLHMDMQPDEDDFMMEVGALNSCCPELHRAEIAMSPRVSNHAAAESVKMLFIFQNLRQLQLRCVTAAAAADSIAIKELHARCCERRAADHNMSAVHVFGCVATYSAVHANLLLMTCSATT
jgi:hypothetical protein